MILISSQFSALLSLVFVVQLSAGIAAYVMRGDIKELLRENLRGSMNTFGEERPHIFRTWNVLQHEVGGVVDPSAIVITREASGLYCNIININYIILA